MVGVKKRRIVGRRKKRAGREGEELKREKNKDFGVDGVAAGVFGAASPVMENGSNGAARVDRYLPSVSGGGQSVCVCVCGACAYACVCGKMEKKSKQMVLGAIVISIHRGHTPTYKFPLSQPFIQQFFFSFTTSYRKL